MDFLKIFTIGRYHRDMKILKVLASNSKQFRVYGIFKKRQIDDDREGRLNTTLSWITSVKVTSGLKNSPGYVF